MRPVGRVLALFAAVCIFCTASGCLDASTTPSEGGGITAVDLPEPEGLTLAGRSLNSICSGSKAV
ncbi:MAG TPA: hypothetical protein PK336_06000 [Methanoculleus sp.]|nr:hypothetical protein [Methanoculleus sp.]